MEVKPVDDHVRLISGHAEAPLLGRLVNYQGLSSTHGKLKSYPLSELSSPDKRRAQEALVVHDLLNVLVGLEGVYIRYSTKFDQYNDVVPEFKIAKVMDPSLKSFSKRIAKLGKYYVVLNKIAEKWSDLKYGVVLQRLGFEIKSYLRCSYLHFIVEKLERNYKENVNFSIREMEQFLGDSEITKHMELLFTLYERIAQEDRLREDMDKIEEDFKNFMEDLKRQGESQNGMILATDTSILPMAKGGIILGIVQDLIHENLGDRSNVSFLRDILNKIAEDYFLILKNWLTKGELSDPFDEFMIVNTMKHVSGVTSLLKYGDRVWDTQYVVRRDGLLKQFSSPSGNNDLLFKLLITGKLLSALRTCLDLNEIPMDIISNTMDHVSTFTELLEGNNLELFIDRFYQRANDLCSKMFLDGYQLDLFLQNLQKYFFGKHNANGIRNFFSQNMNELTRRYKVNGMDKIKLQKNFELEKNATGGENLVLQLLVLQLDSQSFEESILPYLNQDRDDIDFNHEFSGQKLTPDNEVETADLLNANNFQNLKDILLREVRTSDPSRPQNDNAVNESVNLSKNNIHHLCFEIMVPYPLNIIVTRTCVVQYQIISRYLYLLQYYSKLLEDTWIEITKHKIWKYQGYSPIVRQQIVRKCRIIHNKMNQFIKLVQEYFVQDVVEREMGFNITSMPNIHDWQTGLQESLTNIMTNCCLSQLIEIQLQIFEIVHKFCKFLATLRRELCQLDINLYQTFVMSGSGTSAETSANPDNASKNKPFNEEDSLRVTFDLIKYITLVCQGFDQHTIAFKEGLTHYHHSNRASTNSPSGTATNILIDENQSTRLLSSLNF